MSTHVPPSSPHASPSLAPERALLTPVWLGALALLVANDHWLKGADLIPGLLTGKLSDFAGMLVAPVLLASLARVKTTRGLLACHVAVGAVFAGIQVSPAFADLWSAAMGLLGHPWTITSDLTDLIALPFLWLSWRALRPAMDAERPALVGLQRSAVAAASVFGLWATVATSDDGGGGSDTGCWECWDTGTTGEPSWEDVYGNVYIHNPNTSEIAVTIRTLSPSVDLDCNAVAADPGGMLPDEAFGEASHWLLPPETNVAIEAELNCGVAKVGGEGVPEQIIFANPMPSPQTFPGSHDDISELRAEGMAIVFEGSSATWVGGAAYRHTPSPEGETKPQPEACLALEGERRVDWSEMPSYFVFEVQALTPGLDGCHELDLMTVVDGSPTTPLSWYLCVPEAALRFELGARYRLTTSGTQINVKLADPLTGAAATDDLGRELLTMRFARALNTIAYQGLPLETVALPDCAWASDDSCAVVERAATLELDGVPVSVGSPAAYVDDEGLSHEVHLSRLRQLALVDGECSSGSADPSWDIDLVIVSEAVL